MTCRHCNSNLTLCLVDLGSAPPSNAYLSADDLRTPEKWYPLRVMVCQECWLVQTEDYAQADELFATDYAYFSSTSSSWLRHAAQYTSNITNRLGLNRNTFVVELACNDGYLLKNFVAAGIPCLGIEPTDGTADAAEALDVPVLRNFFGKSLGEQLAQDGKQADLIIGNNVYAHVPDINDFTLGMKALLKPSGTITLEFPHVLDLIRHCQFDTIYHEHYSYLSLHTVCRVFEQAGLMVYDVEQLSTHGGSLRIYGTDQGARDVSANTHRVLEIEKEAGLQTQELYSNFQQRTDQIKNDFLLFLLERKRMGKRVAGYGAAAKGNTLLNYAGVRPDLLPFICDAAPSKQGKYMPGSRIPILAPSALSQDPPDFLLVLPWNIIDEVTRNYEDLSKRGMQFAVAIPKIRIN